MESVSVQDMRQFRDHLSRLGFLRPAQAGNTHGSGSLQENGILHTGIFLEGTGITRYAGNVINGMSRRGSTQHLLGVGEWHRYLVGSGRGLGLDDVFLADLGRILEHLTERLLSFALETRPAVIVCHREYPFALMAARAREILGVPYIVVIYGHVSSFQIMRGETGLALSQALTRADRVVCISRYIKELTSERLAWTAENSLVIRGGYDPSTYNPGVRRRLRPTTRTNLLRAAFVGRLDRDKGADLLVQVVDGIHPAKRQFIQLRVAGAGPLRDAIEGAVQVKSLPIEFLGLRSPEQVAHLLGESDVLLAPSRFEGLGIQVIEALAIGTPVIASRVGGLRETGQDSGAVLFTEPESAAAIGGSLTNAIDKRDTLDQLEGVGPRYCQVAGLDWPSVIDRWARLLAPYGLSCEES